MTRLAPILLLVAAPALADEKRPPQGEPGTVTLSLSEYDRLVDRAAKPPKRPEPPPAAAALARAEARLRVAGDTVRGTIALDGEVFRSGPVEVRLLTGATLLDARLSGRPLPLLERSGTHAAIVTGPAPFSIAVDWGAPVTTEPGRAAFEFPAPHAGTVRATVELPGEQADVHVEPGLVTRRVAAGGRTVVDATLVAGSRTRVWWASREAAAQPARPARFLSDVKTLVSLGEADLRLAALVDVTVLQGNADRFELHVPEGLEVTGASGSTLDRTEERPGAITLVVRDATQRRHQFLVSLERAVPGGLVDTETALPVVASSQRETGEAAVEGVGTLELTATESDGMRRMDVREAADGLRGLARQPLLAAFRYQRKAADVPRLALQVKRFPDAPVLAALAERAVVTTLMTSEGRALTEVALTVRNHAQPFLKLALPEGATLLSADVAGQATKPVKGADGTRVPLLRAGFRPTGPYQVSFVYLQSGTPFAKKGQAALGLPPLDLPITVLEWELFLPDRYRLKNFGGNAVPELGAAAVGGIRSPTHFEETGPAGSGRLMGRITDESGTAMPGATVTVEGFGFGRRVTTGADGHFVVDGVPSGEVRASVELEGFPRIVRSLRLNAGETRSLDIPLKVATISETVEVTAEEALRVDTTSSSVGMTDEPQQAAPSTNVFNLQRRVAGVLPVRVDIPRAGASYRFVRPLAIESPTTVSFSYRAQR